jgi:sec-independent protein translocase protein TatC
MVDEWFHCLMQVAGYAGLLLATPTVLYEIVAYVVPGLTKSEKDLLAPIVFGSSILFYVGCAPASLMQFTAARMCPYPKRVPCSKSAV